MKIFDYLFYKIYKLINFLGNTDFYPESNTWLISSTFLWLNILTILNLVELTLERALTNKWYVIVLYILYLILTYKYFLGKDRYKNIIQCYDKQMGIKKMWGTITVVIYIFATIVLHLYFSEARRGMLLSI